MNILPVCSRVLVSSLLICWLAGCERKSDPAEAAQKFFDLLREGRTSEAYHSAAFSFQAQQTPEIFGATVKSLRITNLTSIRWMRKELTEKEVRLDGEMTTPPNPGKPIKLKLVRESGDWKVYSFRAAEDSQTLPRNPFSLVGKSTGFGSAAQHAIPEEPVLKKLVLETLLNFNEAVKKENFADFYATVSTFWQKQLTEQRLSNAFEPFVTARVRLDGIRDVEPVFDPPPRVDPDGLMVVTGYYPTLPYRTFFSLKFMYELPTWKLFGIDVNLSDATTPLNVAP